MFLEIIIKQIFQEFIGLRSKMYSILLWFSEEDKRRNEERIARGQKPIATQKNTAAGVKECVAQKELDHDKYRHTLLNQEDLQVKQTLLRSYKHQVSTIVQQRVGLTAYDDKRYMLEDGINTRAYGHYKNIE